MRGVWLHYAEIAQLVEHWLPKPRVTGSSPAYRSEKMMAYKPSFFCNIVKRGLIARDPFHPFQGLGV